MKSRVTERGQVTIPKKLRDRLGIRPGQTVDFRQEEGKIVLTKGASSDPLDAWFGVLSESPPTDGLVDELRGRADLP
jgi:AbrB family looped-hinge helix DNA binding protein